MYVADLVFLWLTCAAIELYTVHTVYIEYRGVLATKLMYHVKYVRAQTKDKTFE